jgi:glycosyltransferase involved in cell wall biosynthesis
LSETQPAPGSFPARLAVLVPVYHDPERRKSVRADRAHSLQRCLESLVRAVDLYINTAFEITIVVIDDHSPSDPRRKLSDDLLRRVVWVRSEGQKGQAGALNYALKTVAADVFAFTDSDCIVATDWFERMAAHYLRYPSHGGVGGPNWLFDRAMGWWSRTLTSEETALMRFLMQGGIDQTSATSRRIDCRNLSLRADFIAQFAAGRPLFREDGTVSVSGQASYDLQRQAAVVPPVGFCAAMEAYHQPISSFTTQLFLYYTRGRHSSFNEIYAGLYGSLSNAFLRRYGIRHFISPLRHRPLSFWYVWPLHAAFWTGILWRAAYSRSAD